MNSVIYPRISEKSFAQANDTNVYTFVVPASTNKIEIKNNVEKQYDVTVTNVNISVLKGKNKRFMQRRGRQSNGVRQDIKKAYVTLKAGDVIPVYVGETEAQPAVSNKKETK